MVKFIKLLNKTYRIDSVHYIIGEVGAFDGGDKVVLLLEYSEGAYIELYLSKQQAKALKEALEFVTK